MVLNIRELPHSNIITNLYKRYYLQDITPQPLISSHWRDRTSKINVCIDGDGNLTSFKGCGFGDLQYMHPMNKIFNHLCNLSYLIRLPYKKDLLFLMKSAQSNLKMINSYLSYDCFRQICALCVIRQYLNVGEKDKFNVLVIGDGYGFLSSFIKSLYRNAKIVLIDIGKVLLFQAINLQRIHPSYLHYLLEDDNRNSLDKIHFVYVPAENIWKVKNIRYKLIINISSMQEINYETIRDYFRFFRLNSTVDNLFYCSNREKKILIGGEVIEFLKYPWHIKDRHFIDEEPIFYRYFSSSTFPFVYFYDGRMHHRLTNLFLKKNHEKGEK